MDIIFIIPLIQKLQSLPLEVISCILWMVCMGTLLLFFHFFGIHGVYAYNQVAIIAANIQVMKGMQFTWMKMPIALGTVVFSSVYLGNALLAEHYGKEVARKGVWICFGTQVLFTLLMLLTMGHAPLLKENVLPVGTEHMLLADQAITFLFTPSPRLLFSSLFSFSVSQFAGIWVFQAIRQRTVSRWFSLRTGISTCMSVIVDSFVFNFLAWKLLSPTPVDGSVLFSTYILWALVMQGFAVISSIPVIYCSLFIKPLKQL